METRLLQRIFQVRAHEVRPAAWAFAAHFFLFTGYNVLRPLREMIGLRGGARDLPVLFTYTFVVMLAAVPLYSSLVARMQRRRFIPIVYRFFALDLALFAAAFHFLPDTGARWAGYAYFVWLSVFNLFAVSVYWSFMADVFTNAEGKRLFGIFASGASIGSIAGSLLTAAVLPHLPPTSLELLLLVPIVFLELFLLAIRRIGRWLDEQKVAGASAMGGQGAERAARIARADSEVLRAGGIWSGFRQVLHSPYLAGICGYMLCATYVGSQVYFHQGSIVEAAELSDAQKVALFNHINLAVNSVTWIVQAFVVGRVMQRLGVALTLMVLPLFYVAGFSFFASYPVLWALVGFEVARRAVNYAVAKPAKEVLFTVVSRDEKYKSKSFIDTVVYRGGDALGGWGFHALTARLGLSLSAAAWATIPLCFAWAALAWLLGRKQARLSQRPATAAE